MVTTSSPTLLCVVVSSGETTLEVDPPHPIAPVYNQKATKINIVSSATAELERRGVASVLSAHAQINNRHRSSGWSSITKKGGGTLAKIETWLEF